LITNLDKIRSVWGGFFGAWQIANLNLKWQLFD